MLAAVAATRADYHDNVFHFSTLRSPVMLSAPHVPAYQRRSGLNHYNHYQPSHYNAFEDYHAAQPGAYYNQYTPEVSSSKAYYTQHTPAVAANNVYYTQYTPAIHSVYHTPRFTPAVATPSNAAYYQATSSPAVVVDYKPADVIQTPAVAYSSPVRRRRPASPGGQAAHRTPPP